MALVSELSNYFLEACEQAAIASADWRGKGDGKAADAAAVEAMRKTFDKVPFNGRVAIGEGERDEAPMLWIGEPLGSMQGDLEALAVDIAVDPLECTTNCATDSPNSISVLAAAPRGTLLHAPDCYMDKIAAGPELIGEISLEGSVSWNLEQAASKLDKPISELNVVALDRERHTQLFNEINDVGAKLHLMSDGDVSAALWAAEPSGPYDLLLGIGAAPEGVITATAIEGIGGVFEGRLKFKDAEEEERASKMIDDDLHKVWKSNELCKSNDALFVATGVCTGYLPGVEKTEKGIKTTSQIIDVYNKDVKLITNFH
ncbi:MAG: fructose-bisphosphatase class II [Euryarchaeota archaeon]|jgi:fructose-1,6-bisphosphatase class II|nr:fructose-bisphosphatase class II [Euryarchaeota archaeon]|tara:strand:- start:568 stop:1515 length:948 start_codon:yes stop_codon:yes gene_type:complete